MTPDLFLLHLGALFDRAGNSAIAAKCYACAREAKQMRVTLDELAENERQEAQIAETTARGNGFVPLSRVRDTATLGELHRVCREWGAGR